LLISTALAESIKVDITRIPKTKLNASTTTLRQKQMIAYNGQGELMHLQQEDPDTFFLEELFTYPDEHHYMGTLYFGSQRAAANVTFDTGSAYTCVTSDMCFNCPSEVYHPGRSDTVIDRENQWVLSYPHDDNMKLTVHEYSDSVCINENVCVDSFPVYALFNQVGMYPKSDGIIGIAPVPLGTKGEESFIL